MTQANSFPFVNPVLESAGAPGDETLRQALAAHEPWALAALYDEYATVLYSLALKVVQVEAAAQEVVQEVFLTAWQSCNSALSRSRDLGVWLILLCRNHAIAARRAQKHLQTRKNELDAIAEVLAEQAENSITHSSRDCHRLQQWVAILPAEQKTVVEMTYLYGMGTAEIAASMRLTEGQIKTLARQALAAMCEIFRATEPMTRLEHPKTNGK